MFDGITYRNNASPSGTRWGDNGKGSDLTADEIDANIWELYSRLLALETTPPTAVSISNILVSGSQLSFQMSDGSSFGPFTLPIASFRFRGDWANGATYAELDIVNVPQNGLFLARLANTAPASPAVFDPAAVDGSGNAIWLKVFGEETYIYDVGIFFPGKPGQGISDAAPLASHEFVRTASAADMSSSRASLRVAPAADLSFPIQKNFDATAIGSVDFAASETTATFTWPAEVDFAVGDTVQVIAPSAIDEDAADLSITLAFIRGDD